MPGVRTHSAFRGQNWRTGFAFTPVNPLGYIPPGSGLGAFYGRPPNGYNSAMIAATPVRVTGTSANSGAATPYAATLPAACLAGDVLVVAAAGQGTHVTNGMAVQDSVNATPFTTILETQGGSASTRWMQTFVFKTTVDLPAGTTVTLTPYAASTQNGFTVDVYRGFSATIAQAAVGSSNASGTTSAAPALAAAPAAGSLVLTFCQAGSGTLTPAATFAAGSSNVTNNSVASGYAPMADGSSTYASTWALGTANTSCAQTVALAVATSGVNANAGDAANAHTTSDVTATITTTDGTAPALAHTTSNTVFGLGVSDGTAPALAHNSFDATNTITTTDGTAPANAHTTADPAPGVAVPDVTAPALAHATFDATVSTTSVLNVNAGDAANAHAAGDPAPSLAVPDVTAPALAHTTSDAGVTLTTTDGTAPALAHNAGDPAPALSLADGTAPALAHTTGQPAPAIAVPDGTAPAITHQAFDATVSTAVILNVNAVDAADTHAAGDPSVKIDQPDPTAPANAHTTQAPSAGLGYADVTAPATTHTTSNAAPLVGGGAGAPATTHQSFDLGVTQTTLAEGTFTTHVTFDATASTSTAPPAFVDVGGSSAPTGGVDGSATQASSEGQSMPGGSTDAGRASSSGLESGATTGSLVG